MVRDTPPSQGASTHQMWDSYLKQYRRYAPSRIILKARSTDKVTVTLKMVCDTQPSQDASIHQIWNSYLKEYRKYAPDSMPIIETRSEVNATVTKGWYATLRHPKMHAHTKFWIPTSKNIGDMLQTRLF